MGVIRIASLAVVDAISGIAGRSLKIRLIGSISNDEGDGNDNDNDNDKRQKLLESNHRQNLPLEHRSGAETMHVPFSVLTLIRDSYDALYIRNGEVYTFLNFGVGHGFCLEHFCIWCNAFVNSSIVHCYVSYY